MSASEGALLALIVDDADAIHALAAWAALELQLDDAGDRATVASVAELAGITFDRAGKALQKLRAARVLVDGGITDLADRMLQSHVQARLAANRTRK